MSIHQNPKQVPHLVRGVVFDMDGTLTIPCIDFDEMRRRVGIAEGDILSVVDSWDTERRGNAYAIITEIEEQALQEMRIMPGANELCALLDASEVRRAIVTRNVSASIDFFLKTYQMTHKTPSRFFPALSREWRPYKPDPAALHHIAEHWGINSAELVMIGDSATVDVVCANCAGAASILLDTHGKYFGLDDPKLVGRLKPDFLVRSLEEAAEVLQTKLRLSPTFTPVLAQ